MGSGPASGAWTGRIQLPGAALRSLPHKDERAPEQGVLARLPPGTQVTVLRLHRGWLQVGVVLGGTTRLGYVSPERVQPVPLRASAGAARPAPAQEGAAEVPVNEGKLWKSETEVDALVATRGSGGRWRLVELEQAKTGNRDTLTGAREQNTNALAALQELAAGSQKVRLRELPSKNTLGRDLTRMLDLSVLHEVRTATRGVAGKKFDRSLPFSREVLQEVALALIEQGLPPTPASPAPVTAPPSRDSRGE